MASLTYIAPFFVVNNLPTAVSFYVEQLAFDVLHMSPGNTPLFAIVGRDNISIMLKETGAAVKPLPNHVHHADARWDAYISVSDPDELYAAYQGTDVTFHQSLQDDDDGLRGFEVADADGYVLFFGRPK